MELRDKVAFVTGANGFVGTYVAQRLRAEGVRVRAMVRHPEAQGELERLGVETLVGDFTDASAQQRAVKGAHFVVHCAASGSDDLAEARRVNTEATATLAQAALTASCERFVHISTVAVYPLRKRESNVDEASPLATEGDAYALSKAEGEQALNAVVARGLKAVILRPGAILGVHPTSTWGTRMPQLIQAGQFPLLDGGRYRLGYLHISTLTEAVVRALSVDEAVGQVFNVIDGHVSFGQYADCFPHGPLPNVPPEQAPGFLSFSGSYANEKAQRVLGVVPRDVFASGM